MRLEFMLQEIQRFYSICSVFRGPLNDGKRTQSEYFAGLAYGKKLETSNKAVFADSGEILEVVECI